MRTKLTTNKCAYILNSYSTVNTYQTRKTTAYRLQSQTKEQNMYRLDAENVWNAENKRQENGE